MELQLKASDAPKLKITLIGKGIVGKTSLVYSYLGFSVPQEHDPTIEDTMNKFETINGKEILLGLVDTAGEEDYQNMLDKWIEEGDSFMLIYAINDKQSFLALDSKVQRIKKHSGKSPCLLVVGNKKDLENQREVTYEEAAEFAKEIGAEYVETCAINNDDMNVTNAFKKIVMNSLQKMPDMFKNTVEEFHGTIKRKRNTCCCNIF